MTQVSYFLQKLKEKGVEVSFNQVGNGNKTFFTFAGVGMDERYFSKYFSDQEKLNQFFHFYIKVNNYRYKNEIPELWMLFIDALIEEYQIETFNIIAYSIGARLSYPLLNQSKLNKVFLICPDGIITEPLFFLATKTSIGEILFPFVFKSLKVLFPTLKRFIRLSSVELFNIWKLYSVFMFPSVRRKKMTVFLATSDYICSSKRLFKLFTDNNLDSCFMVDSTHFSILTHLDIKVFLS